MKKILTICIASATLLLTTGCATGYREFYKPAAGIDAEQIARLRSAPPPENPIVERIGQVDPQSISDAYIKRGYVIIGSSFFNTGRNESEGSAVQMAKDVKADLVLIVNPKFTGSVTTSVPIVTPTTSTTYSTGTASAYGSGGYATAYGSGVSTTYGSVTNYVPVTVNRVDYGAIFFVKPKISLGIVARDMNDEERQIAQTNMGAIVRVIINDTPAFYADVLPGDRLLEIDGLPVYSAQAYTKMLGEKKGKKYP
jgi:serine protease Do